MASRFGQLRKVAKAIKGSGYVKQPSYVNKAFGKSKGGFLYKNSSGSSLNLSMPAGGKLQWSISSPVKRQGNIYGATQHGNFTRKGTIQSSRSMKGAGLASLQGKLKKSKAPSRRRSGQDTMILHGKPGGHAGYGV